MVQNLIFSGMLYQIGSIIRMSYINQGLGPFSERTPFQIRHSVFGNDSAHGFEGTELIGQFCDRQANVRVIMKNPGLSEQRLNDRLLTTRYRLKNP